MASRLHCFCFKWMKLSEIGNQKVSFSIKLNVLCVTSHIHFRIVKLQTNKFQRLFKDFSRTKYSFQGLNLSNKSAFFTLFFNNWCMAKHTMESFTIFKLFQPWLITLFYTFCNNTLKNDLQVHLRNRNNIWDKETETFLRISVEDLNELYTNAM